MRGTIALLAALAACSSTKKPEHWKVTEITRDGLIRVERGGEVQPLRLSGVLMPPETGPDAPATARALRELIGGKKVTWVVIRPARREGYTIFGPDTGDVTAGDVNVNADIIARGWARAVPVADGGMAELVALEDQARAGKLGAFSAAHRGEVVAWLRDRARGVSSSNAGDLEPAAFRRMQWGAIQMMRREDLEFFGHVITDDDLGPPPCVDRLAATITAASTGAPAEALRSAFTAGGVLVDVPVDRPMCQPWQVRADQLVRTVDDAGGAVTETRGYALLDLPAIDWRSHSQSGPTMSAGGSGAGPSRLVAATDTALLIGHEPWFRTVEACQAAIAAVPECK